MCRRFESSRGHALAPVARSLAAATLLYGGLFIGQLSDAGEVVRPVPRVGRVAARGQDHPIAVLYR